MKIKYLPKNVFLDTNIFEENNYLQGSSIQNIFEYSKEGIISLFMTQISRWELKNRIYKNIEDAVEEQKKYYNSINKTRVLRNLKRYKNITKPTLDISAASNEVFNQIENLIESCNVKFIDSNSVDCDNVFDLYFKRQPPFSKEQNKKHEFPDAFIIMTIDKWCELNSTKMIFVTKDKNFNGYKSNRIIFKNDLLELLSDITIYYDSIRSNKILPEIDRRVKYYEEELLIYVENYIEEKLKHDIEFKDYYLKVSNKSCMYQIKYLSLRC